MSLFSHLETEAKVQINDRTRLSGVKSFQTKGGDEITTMTIKAGSDGSAISVFDIDPELRYLDWEFSTFNIDIDSSNNKIDFLEGATAFAATLSSSTYTLAALATEIKTQMESAGAYTYTITVSGDNKMTIAADGSFSLLPTTGTNFLTCLLPTLGFKPQPGAGDSLFASALTFTGDKIRSLPKAIVLSTGDGTLTSNETRYVNIYSVAGDALFSSDADLINRQSDILKYVREGRNSFLDYHRAAQEHIISFLDEEGHIDINSNRLTVDAFVDIEEVRQWSKYVTLRLIHDDISNSIDDIFHQKAKIYEAEEIRARNRAMLRIDIDGDGKADIGEGISVRSARAIRV